MEKKITIGLELTSKFQKVTYQTEEIIEYQDQNELADKTRTAYSNARAIVITMLSGTITVMEMKKLIR